MKLLLLLPLLLCAVLGAVVRAAAESPEAGQLAAGNDLNHEFAIRTWDFEAGLPHGSINSVARTSDGYLWLGTSSGLVRFDGLRFVLLTQQEISALNTNRIVGVTVDSAGELWAVDGQGTILHQHAGQFTGSKLPLPGYANTLMSFAREASGSFWLAGSNGVFRVDPSLGSVSAETNGLPSEFDYWQTHSTIPLSFQISCDAAGRIWYLAAGKIYSWDNDHWRPAPGTEQIPWEAQSFCRSRDGGIWVGTVSGQELRDRGARVYKLVNGRVERELNPYPWDQNSIRSRVVTMLEDSTGRVWVGTQGAGVFIWSSAAGWRRLAMEGPLAQLFIGAIEEGKGHAFWIATQPTGLHRVEEQIVQSFRLPSEVDTALSTAHVAHDGTVWVGTYDAGVFQLDHGRFIQRTNGLLNLQVGVIFEDSRSNLWVGTWGGLHRWNGQSFLAVTNPPQFSTVVRAMAEQTNGDLWITTSEGLVRLRNNEAKVYWTNAGIDHLYLHAVTTGPDGRAWLAVTDRGLYRQNGDRFELVAARGWEAGPSIRALLADKDGAIWIATWGYGLYRFYQGSFRHWNSSDGLPDDMLHSVVEDEDGNLWMSSDNGIFGCSKTALLAHVAGQDGPLLCWRITTADGLETSVCEGAGQPMIGRSADGRLWVPNQRSLVVFDPRKVASATSAMPVLLEEVRVDGISYAAAPALSISSANRRVEFQYSSPNLRVPERLRFRYRLQGLEETWVDAGNQRTAVYSHLRPGNYEFQAMVGGPDGHWRETRNGLKLVVVPRFWERRSVQASAALALLVVVSAMFWAVGRVRLHRRLERIQFQQTMEAERRRIATDLHDDLGAGLTEVVLLGEIARREPPPGNGMRERVSEMTEKSRALIAAMDEIVWTVNPRNDRVPNLAVYLAETGRAMFKNSASRFRVDMAVGLPNLPLTATARHALFLAVKEALHNALKHSQATEVWLRIVWTEPQLKIAIEDNGCGFDPATLNSVRNGINNMRQRMMNIGGTCSLASSPGAGTKLLFTLSIHDQNGIA